MSSATVLAQFAVELGRQQSWMLSSSFVKTLPSSVADFQSPALIYYSRSRCERLSVEANAIRSCKKLPALVGGVGAAGILSLTAASPAMASEVFQAGAFIPGLVGDDPFREGFISAFLLIFFSEIGDKTFFIAVLLALREAKSVIFAGTFGALGVMTVISVGLGRFLHQLDELLPPSPVPVDDLLATALLIWFGVTTLAAAGEANETADEEREEAKEVVEGFNTDSATVSLLVSTFALVFAAEWGDKSFLATIALAAASSPAGVVGGAVAGHGVATAIAVLGGSFLGKYLSEKVVQYIGGSLFLLFAAATIFDIVTGAH